MWNRIQEIFISTRLTAVKRKTMASSPEFIRETGFVHEGIRLMFIDEEICMTMIEEE